MKPYAKPVVRSASKCLVEDCQRPEEFANGRPAGGLCAAHRWRKKRGLELASRPIYEQFARTLTPLQQLQEAAFALDAAPVYARPARSARYTPEELAVRRLKHAAVRYANHHASKQKELTPSELLIGAARALREVDGGDDEGFAKALERLTYFACLYARHLGSALAK